MVGILDKNDGTVGAALKSTLRGWGKYFWNLIFRELIYKWPELEVIQSITASKIYYKKDNVWWKNFTLRLEIFSNSISRSICKHFIYRAIKNNIIFTVRCTRFVLIKCMIRIHCVCVSVKTRHVGAPHQDLWCSDKGYI